MKSHGTGGQAKLSYYLILSNNHLLEYLVNNHLHDHFLPRLKIYRPILKVIQYKNLVCAIGDNSIREKIYHKIKNWYRNKTMHYHRTKDSRFSEVGDGTVILEHACLKKKITIGNQSDMNIASASEHERPKEDFSLRSPQFTLASKIILRIGIQVDIEAFVILDVTRGSNSFIGA